MYEETDPLPQIQFNGSPKPTIGVEAELFLIDPQTLDLTDGAPAILAHFAGDPHVKPELVESIIEVNTGICESTTQVRGDLGAKIAKVAEAARTENVKIASMGTHPFARWSDALVTDNERYQGFLQRMQFPVRRLLISGLHVHIGVPDGEQAIAVMNGLLRYIPHMVGLSANSPYWDGEITGLASTRMKVFEGMPTGGLPPRLNGYNQFRQLMRTLIQANAIDSISEIWWDIRPHPGFGTVELRIMDAVPTIGQMVSLAAFAQCLVVSILKEYETAQQSDLMPEWVVRENKWRAVRYGLDAEIIVDDDGTQVPIRDDILALIEKLRPIAIELDCLPDLTDLVEIVAAGVPGEDQMKRYKASARFEDVVKGAIKDLGMGE